MYLNSFRKKFIKNFSIGAIGQGIGALFSFFSSIIIARHIAPESYGVFILAQSYMLLVDGLINFQSWQTVIRFGCDAIERGDKKCLRAVVKGGVGIDVLSAFLGGLLAIALVQPVGKILGWSEQCIWIARLFCFEIFVYINGSFTGVLRIFNKFYLIALFETIFAVIRLGLLFVLFNYTLSIEKFAIFTVAFDIIKNLSFFAMGAIISCREMGFKNLIHSDKESLPKGFLSYSLWSNLSATADVPIKYLDSFFLSSISLSIVAVYKVYKQLLNALSLVSTPISQATMPQFGELVAQKNYKQAYKIVLKLRNITFAVFIPCIILASFIAKPVISAVMGEAYGNNIPLFIFLLANAVCGLSYIAIHPFFSILGFAKQSAFITIIANVFYVGLSFLFIRLFGVYGLVLASFCQFLITVEAKTIYIKKHCPEVKNMSKNHKDIEVLILCHLHHNELGLCRQLGQNGVRPVGIIKSEKKRSFLSSSRYWKKLYFVSDEKEILSLLQELQFASKPVLLTGSDDMAMLVDNNYDLLSAKYHLSSLAKKQGELSKYMDKMEQYKWAVKEKIPMAKSLSLKINSTIQTGGGVLLARYSQAGGKC